MGINSCQFNKGNTTHQLLNPSRGTAAIHDNETVKIQHKEAKKYVIMLIRNVNQPPKTLNYINDQLSYYKMNYEEEIQLNMIITNS